MKRILKTIAISTIVPSIVVLSGCGNNAASSKAEKPTTTDAKVTEKSPADGQKLTLKLGFATNEGHPQAQGAHKFKEIVEQKTSGKIKIDLYPSATLGDDKKSQDNLKAGTQDLLIGGTSTWVGEIKEYGILDFPFLFQTPQEVDTVLDGPIGQKFLDKLPAHGVIGLAYWENGFRHVTNNKHPIEKLEDLSGIKLRTMQTPVHIEVFKALGANPSPLAFSEVFSALESKTIDAEENPFVMIDTMKFYEVQKYLSLTNHAYQASVFQVSKKTWDKLSDNEKSIIKDAAIEAGKFQRQVNRDEDKKLLDKLKQAGMKVNEVKPEEIKRMQDKVQPVINDFAQKYGEDLVKEIYTEIDKVRKK